MSQGSVGEYRIINGKVVKVKTIHFSQLDNRGGSVIITKEEWQDKVTK